MEVDAVVVAGGNSTRFGEQNKLLAELSGVSVVARSVRLMASAPSISRIILVGPEGLDAEARAGISASGRALPLVVVRGGPRRRDSVEAGLRAATTDYVAIHDAARPLAEAGLVERVIAAAGNGQGAIAATAVADTIKSVDDDSMVTGHPDRTTLRAAQTPQVVPREAWLRAAAGDASDTTDDAAMVARVGVACVAVEGSAANLKITHEWDLVTAEAILATESLT